MVKFNDHLINVGKDLTQPQLNSLIECLNKNSDVFPSGEGVIGKVKNINYQIPIKEGSKPVKHAPPRSTLEKVKIVEDAVDQLIDQGIVRPSISQWASRTVLVQKKDGKPRICIDYRDVNKTIVSEPGYKHVCQGFGWGQILQPIRFELGFPPNPFE